MAAFDPKEKFIPAQGVRSLCWESDHLVDWAAGGARYYLDGSKKESQVIYAYRFDSAVVSPSGRYAAIYERLGTKGLILDGGKILREINRSFYHAEVYEYPICLFQLPDGHDVIAHCPGEYNKIEIEDLAIGECLTNRQSSEATDFFHSRLIVNPGATKLVSAGWMWHPHDSLIAYDIEEALSNPGSLDRDSTDFIYRHDEVGSVAFVNESLLAVSSSNKAENLYDDYEGQRLTRGNLAIYDLETDTFPSMAHPEEEVGTMMPVRVGHVVGFYGYPKLIELQSGKVLHRWPKINSGKQLSSIIFHHEMPPPMALDPANRRFAVSGEDGITVVTL